MHLFPGSRYPEINKRISAWVNKNKEFPDYVDVLNLVKKVTKQSSLPLRPETVRVQGKIQRKTFTLLYWIVFHLSSTFSLEQIFILIFLKYFVCSCTAQEIFRDVGRMLKERRESDDLYNIYGYAEEEMPDPAAEDDELSRKLQENETIAKQKLDKVGDYACTKISVFPIILDKGPLDIWILWLIA